MEEFISLPANPLACALCAGHEVARIQGSDTHWVCASCDLRFLEPTRRLGPADEEGRYRQHNNDEHDPAYQNFVAPLFRAVRERLSPGARGLDFGAGPGPALAYMFSENGFPTSLFDIFFWPDQKVLDKSYDFIVASEVAEHLYFPRQELRRLHRLLKPGGWLGIMTLLYRPDIDFLSWFYARDPTHVVFYSRTTFAWIEKHFEFSGLTYVGERIVLLQRPDHDKSNGS